MIKQIHVLILIVLTGIVLGTYLPAVAQSSDPSQDVLVLTDETGGNPLGRYVDILEDPGGELSIADVTSPEIAGQFVHSEAAVPNFGYTDSVFWLRLPLRNEASQTSTWLLESLFPSLNYLDLYLPLKEGGFIKKETGALRPFATRDIPFYHVVFEVPLAPESQQTLYLRVESGSSMTLAFTLWAPEKFALVKTNDMLGIGLFYGALLIIFGYQTVLLITLRDPINFYSLLFLAGAILFFGTYEGIADQYLWSGVSLKKHFLLATTMALFFIAALKFSDVFLEQKNRSPLFHRLYYLFYGYWGFVMVLALFASYSTLGRITSVGLLLTPLLATIAGFHSWKNGYQPARFYLLSWAGFLMGVFTAELVRLDVLPSTPFTERSYQIGLLWLVLLWSLAIADRINLLKGQTEDANRALRSSERRLAQILEGLPLGVVVYGKDQKPNFINRRTIEILSNPARGVQPDLAAGRTLSGAIDYFSFRVSGSDEKYPLDQLPVYRALLGEPAAADNIEADLVDKRVPLEIWANPVRDELGNVETAVVAFQDISQRKQAEAELVEYRNHLEKLVHARTEELSAINDQLSYEIAERKTLEMILQKRIRWLSAVNHIQQSINGTADLPDAYHKLAATILDMLNAESVFVGVWNGQSSDFDAICRLRTEGSSASLRMLPVSIQKEDPLYKDLGEGLLLTYPADQISTLPHPFNEFCLPEDVQTLVVAPLKSRQGLIGLLGLGIDQPAQAVKYEELNLIERVALDLAELAEDARLIEKAQALAASEERNRLARDLHDSVTQVLFSASLVAEVLPQIWRRDPLKAEQSLAELQRLTRGALAEMRTLLLELRPAAVTKTPLSELLAQLTEAITSRTGLPFQLFIEQIPVLPEQVQTSFYRIAQEGLNNVVKHAHASLVTVSLSATPAHSATSENGTDEVKLIIKDDGKGFSSEDDHRGNMGLSIIRERAALINADANIDSQPGRGTELVLTWHA